LASFWSAFSSPRPIVTRPAREGGGGGSAFGLRHGSFHLGLLFTGPVGLSEGDFPQEEGEEEGEQDDERSREKYVFDRQGEALFHQLEQGFKQRSGPLRKGAPNALEAIGIHQNLGILKGTPHFGVAARARSLRQIFHHLFHFAFHLVGKDRPHDRHADGPAHLAEQLVGGGGDAEAGVFDGVLHRQGEDRERDAQPGPHKNDVDDRGVQG